MADRAEAPAPAPTRALPSADRPPVVAITRSVDDNRSLAARLNASGIDVVAVPLVEVAAPSDGGRALAAALAELEAYDWMVVTSANGARAVIEVGGERSWPAGLSVAAVGPATAAAARAGGLPVELEPEVATAAELVAVFPARGSGATPGGRVLAPLADLASDTVETGLAAKGWRVDRVEAYRTVAPTDLGGPGQSGGAAGLPVGELDAVTFFSPSAVDRWVDRYGADGPAAVCVGPATAARARARGFAAPAVAEPHTEEGVVSAVIGLLG